MYIDYPDPIAFMSVTVDTSGRSYDDFSCLLFLHAHRETSAFANELPEESGQFRFLHAACLDNIKGSVGLILVRVSFVLGVLHHSYLLPSYFLLSVTKWHMRGSLCKSFIGFFLLLIFVTLLPGENESNKRLFRAKGTEKQKGKQMVQADSTKRVTPEFSPFHFFHFSLYQDGTKWVCTTRDVPGTKTSGRNGKMSEEENSGVTRFLQSVVVPIGFFSLRDFREAQNGRLKKL